MPDERLEKARWMAQEFRIYGQSGAGTANGVFRVRYKNELISVVASDDQGEGWEHVSVSLPNRTPTWAEMCYVKELFWRDDEAVMQLHPSKDDYVNNHRFCLHLWRPTKENIPLPPAIYVGVKSAGVIKSDAEAMRLRELALKELP